MFLKLGMNYGQSVLQQKKNGQQVLHQVMTVNLTGSLLLANKMIGLIHLQVLLTINLILQKLLHGQMNQLVTIQKDYSLLKKSMVLTHLTYSLKVLLTVEQFSQLVQVQVLLTKLLKTSNGVQLQFLVLLLEQKFLKLQSLKDHHQLCSKLALAIAKKNN